MLAGIACVWPVLAIAVSLTGGTIKGAMIAIEIVMGVDKAQITEGFGAA